MEFLLMSLEGVNKSRFFEIKNINSVEPKCCKNTVRYVQIINIFQNLQNLRCRMEIS